MVTFHYNFVFFHSRGLGSAVRRAFGASVARRASSFTSVEQFTKRQAGSVDVWWLYDDGGELALNLKCINTILYRDIP